MTKKSAYIQILTTIDDSKRAAEIAATLVDKGLAACVQILGPIKSVYRWQGKRTTDREWLCVIKTRQSLFRQCEQQIKALHSYDIPEIIALDIVAGHPPYFDWLEESLQ